MVKISAHITEGRWFEASKQRARYLDPRLPWQEKNCAKSLCCHFLTLFMLLGTCSKILLIPLFTLFCISQTVSQYCVRVGSQECSLVGRVNHFNLLPVGKLQLERRFPRFCSTLSLCTITRVISAWSKEVVEILEPWIPLTNSRSYLPYTE